jgi:hypothetical protein
MGGIQWKTAFGNTCRTTETAKAKKQAIRARGGLAVSLPIVAALQAAQERLRDVIKSLACGSHRPTLEKSLIAHFRRFRRDGGVAGMG